MIKTLAPNTKGRDFVVGDLHGMFDVLLTLLTHVGFDPNVDRLIGAGDMVDRGPDSLKCLSLLNEPWFHTVIANHEQLMLQAFDGGPYGSYWVPNGGMWGYGALELRWTDRTPTDEEAALLALLPKVRDLPFVITIERPDGKKFHVIHAELPPQTLITDATLADPEAVARLAQIEGREGEYFTWGRYLFGKFNGMNLSNVNKIKRTIAYQLRQDAHLWAPGLSHVISGHTIMHRPLTLLNRTNIDTGAFMIPEGRNWPALTMVDLGSWTFYQANGEECKTAEPLVVNIEDIREVLSSSTPLIDALNQGQP